MLMSQLGTIHANAADRGVPLSGGLNRGTA